MSAELVKQKTIEKLNKLIDEANDLLLNKASHFDYNQKPIDESKFSAFRTSALSFLKMVLGDDSLYYQRFYDGVRFNEDYNLVLAIELFNRIIADINDGWIGDVKKLISAELFNNFLEMAEYLLNEGYKDASAVIIGSVLEENLRALCLKNNIAIVSIDSKTQKVKPNKAETMNVDLAKAGVYNTLTQKSITSWLGIRNSAAHGKYEEYDLRDVKNLLGSVMDFITKFI